MKIQPTPEKYIQQAIIDVLELLGVPCSPTDASRAFGPDGKPRRSKVAKGWFDVTGCMPDGRFLGIEVKSAKGRHRPDQKARAESVQALGGVVILARSVDDVLVRLRQEGVKTGRIRF